MNLFRESNSFLRWYWQVVRTFFQVRFWSTLLVVILSTLSRILTVLSTVLPFKILLLAASDGVPRYFTFLVSPQYKSEWVLVLGIGLFISYITSIYLESIATKISESASDKVLEKAEVIPLLNNQNAVARDYYSTFCKIFAEIVFFSSGVVVGFYLNFWLFSFLMLLIAFLFCLTALLLRTSDHVHPGALASYIRDNLNNYLGTNSTIVFLLSFLVLLIPFLVTDYSNVLAAVISVILIRQLLNGLKTAIKDAVKLNRAKHKVNALVFPDIQFMSQESQLEKAHRNLFRPSIRQERVYQELSRILHLEDNPEVLWQDSTISGVDTFAITTWENPGGGERHFQQQVFPPKQYHKLEHERFLFYYIPRERLYAPEVITTYFAGPFQCQICDYGSGKHVAKKLWNEAQWILLQRIWAVAPVADLVRSYSSSTPLLHHRLHDDLNDRLQVAVNMQDDKEILNNFRKALPHIRERLHGLPLCIYNPAMKMVNVVHTGDNDYLQMTWCGWSLEPMGAGLPSDIRQNGLAELLESVRPSRKDVPEEIALEDIELAALCFDMEDLIRKKRYNAAIQLIEQILNYTHHPIPQ